LGGTHSYFISYSHHNLEAADHVESLLRRRRRVFIRDENELKPGDAIKKGLEEAISESDTFVVLWSDPALKSAWCRWERETALRVQAERAMPKRFVLPDWTVPSHLRNSLARFILPARAVPSESKPCIN
jgi:hypothetical protein